MARFLMQLEWPNLWRHQLLCFQVFDS